MRRLFLCTLIVCSSLAACASRNTNPPASNANAGLNSDQKISFGVYDISSTSPLSAIAESLAPAPAAHGARPAVAAETNHDTRAQQVSPSQSAPAINTTSADRKVIRNAELSLEVENPEDSQRKITAVAESRGGFVVESQQSGSDVTSTTTDIVVMTVRMPSDNFSDALADIRNVASRVVIETIRGQDVTEEFIDVEAQLRAKAALEIQFMEIMKRSNTVEDALNVQAQLASVRGEIERIEGRKRFLENQSSLSTIKVRMQTPRVFAAASIGFGDRLVGAFSSGFDVAINFLLGLITFVIAVLPFVVFICLPAFLGIRYFWNRQERPKSVIDLAESELKST